MWYNGEKAPLPADLGRAKIKKRTKMRAFTSPRIERAVDPLFDLLREADGRERCFVLVPDRYTQTFEEQILRRTGKTVTFTTEVFSFSRLLYRLKKREDRSFLSREQGVMVLKKLIADRQGDLRSYRRSALTRNFADTLYDLLQKLRLEGFDFERALSLPLREPLRRRLEDIALLDRAYRDFLADGWVDAPDLLAELPALCGQLKDTRVFLAGFSQFSKAERAVIASFLQNAAGVDLFCARKEGGPAALNEVFFQVRALCQKLGQPFEEIEVPQDPDPLREKLEGFLWEGVTAPVICEGRLSLFAVESREAQMRELARRIRLLTHAEGVRFREIALLFPSPQTVRTELTRVFSEYGIPCFFDRKIPLRTHPAARFALALLAAAERSDSANIFRLVKNPCFGADPDQTDAFENAALALGTEYGGFFRPFPEDVGEEAEAVRQRLADLLNGASLPARGAARRFADALSAAVADGSGPVEEMIRGLREAGEQAEADFLEQGQSKLETLLSRLGEIFGRTELSVGDFAELVEAGCDAELSLSPSLFDAVTVGDLQSAFFQPVRFLFGGDLQLGFPPAAESGGLLSDRDLAELSGPEALPFDSDYQNAHSRAAADQLLLKPWERAFFCYLPGEGPLPEKLNALFALLPDAGRSDSLNERIREVRGVGLSGFEAAAGRSQRAMLSALLENYSAANAGEPFNRDLLDGLYGLLSRSGQGPLLRQILTRPDPAAGGFAPEKLFFPGKMASVSSLETFFSCPFKHFLQYGLKLRRRSESRLDQLDFGNLLHAAAERYVRRGNFEAPVREELEAVWEEIRTAPDFEAAFADPKNADQLSRLKRECERFLTEIGRQFLRSDFSNLAVEAEFGMGDRTFPAAEIPGSPVRLHGKIDRVDVAEADGHRFARVIDYKSGRSEFSQTAVRDGVKLQLLIYLCVLRAAGWRPAGAYYFPVRDRFDRPEKNPYRLQGPTLWEFSVLKASDWEIFSGEESFLPVYLKKESTPDQPVLSARSALFTPEQFDRALDFVLEKAKEGVDAVLAGQAEISPYRGACAYCEFKGICQNYKGEHLRAPSGKKLFGEDGI